MANILKCRRCGADITIRRPSEKMVKFEQRTRRFCSKDCYDTWWNEQRSRRVTRSEVAVKIIGTPDPTFALTDVQAAWLAGLIDGEGCIGIWRQPCQGNRSGFTYRAAVEVANTNRHLLETIAKVVDGWVSLKDARRTNPRHKVLHQLIVRPRAVRRLLEQVAPFLVIKRRQAELVIEFRRIMEAAPMRTHQEHEAFAALWTENKALNKRGVA